MANWRATVDIKAEWIASNADKEKVTELVTKVVAWMDERLKVGIFKDDSGLEELRDEFKSMLTAAKRSKSKPVWGVRRIAKFDALWSDFYDWCDSNLVWVKTF
jgi:hypothetical protein